MKGRRHTSCNNSFQKGRIKIMKSETFSTESNESVNIASKESEKDPLNFKSVIFCLELRKSFNKLNLRYVKHSFYLMRSLFKETKVSPRRSSSGLKINSIIERKAVLKEILQSLQEERIVKQKKIFFYMFKNLLNVKIFQKKRVESVLRITRVFQKKLQLKFNEFKKRCNYIFNKWEELNLATKKLEKIISRRITSKILCNFTKITQFSILYKPKQNLPIIKFQPRAERSPVHEKIHSHTKSLFLQQMKNKNTEKNEKYQKALIRMCVLNRNHLIAKKRYFQHFLAYCKIKKLADSRNKGIKLKKSMFRIFKNTFNSMLESIKYIEIYKNNLRIFLQKLDFVFYKISMNSKANSLACISSIKKKPILRVKAAKSLLNFIRIINLKLFSKYFLAFISIQGFQGRIKITTPSKIKKQFKVVNTVLRIIESRKYKTLFGAFVKLKIVPKLKQTQINLFLASSFLGDILGRLCARESYNSKLLSFNIIRSHSISAQINMIRGSKLYFLLKHHYIRALALSFL